MTNIEELLNRSEDFRNLPPKYQQLRGPALVRDLAAALRQEKEWRQEAVESLDEVQHACDQLRANEKHALQNLKEPRTVVATGRLVEERDQLRAENDHLKHEMQVARDQRDALTNRERVLREENARLQGQVFGREGDALLAKLRARKEGKL